MTSTQDLIHRANTSFASILFYTLALGDLAVTAAHTVQRLLRRARLGGVGRRALRNRCCRLLWTVSIVPTERSIVRPPICSISCGSVCGEPLPRRRAAH